MLKQLIHTNYNFYKFLENYTVNAYCGKTIYWFISFYSIWLFIVYDNCYFNAFAMVLTQVRELLMCNADRAIFQLQYREKSSVWRDEDNVFVLTRSCASLLEQVCRQKCCSTLRYYSDIEPTNLCSYYLMKQD